MRRALPSLVLVHRVILLGLFLLGGCAHTGPVPKPVACLLPSAEDIATKVAACVLSGGDPSYCTEEAGLAELLPYIECIRAAHVAGKCGGACPFDRAAPRRPTP